MEELDIKVAFMQKEWAQDMNCLRDVKKGSLTHPKLIYLTPEKIV
jgi:hypothetical protein